MLRLTGMTTLALLAALSVAACGGSGGQTTASGAKNKQLALAECMRSHGVTSFPDPTQGPNAGGLGFSVGATPGSSTVTIDGTAFAGPAFTAAEKSCKLFGGGTSPPPISGHQKQQQVNFARCMRAHGVPSWADPTFPAGGGVQGGGPANGSVRSSPAAQKAIKTCNRLVGL